MAIFMATLVVFAVVAGFLQGEEATIENMGEVGCIFPFRYKGVWYQDCSRTDREKAWCSKDMEFKGNWKFCRDGAKTDVGKECFFPFQYKGDWYHECTTANKKEPWCSKDMEFSNSWKYCGESGSKPTCKVAGDYPHATITVSGNKIKGVWKNGRPIFNGEFTSNCKGTINFPDHRTFNFEYRVNDCTFIWDGKQHGMDWTKTTCGNSQVIPTCGLAGKFPHASMSISGNDIKGVWNNGRPNFYGQFTSQCAGKMTFPDHRTFDFKYDTKTCSFIWDGKKHGDDWTKLGCLEREQCEMAGEYGVAAISFNGKTASGKWENGRPSFSGVLTSFCSGRMNFPDDRVYTFRYDKKTCKIFWDGDHSGNTWSKPRCGDCHLAGAFPHASLTISGKTVKGVWKNGRPNFYGTFTGPCSGKMTFPDHRTFDFKYDGNTCTIIWDGQKHGADWTKSTCG